MLAVLYYTSQGECTDVYEADADYKISDGLLSVSEYDPYGGTWEVVATYRNWAGIRTITEEEAPEE